MWWRRRQPSSRSSPGFSDAFDILGSAGTSGHGPLGSGEFSDIGCVLGRADLHRKDVRAPTGVVGSGVTVIFGVLFGRHDVSVSPCSAGGVVPSDAFRRDRPRSGCGEDTQRAGLGADDLVALGLGKPAPHAVRLVHSQCVRTTPVQDQTAAADLLGASLPFSAGRAAFVLRVLSIPRHAPRICQSQTSVTATGSLRVSATFVIPFGDATPPGQLPLR